MSIEIGDYSFNAKKIFYIRIIRDYDYDGDVSILVCMGDVKVCVDFDSAEAASDTYKKAIFEFNSINK